MRTTVSISDELLAAAERLAQGRGQTLDEVVDAALAANSTNGADRMGIDAPAGAQPQPHHLPAPGTGAHRVTYGHRMLSRRRLLALAGAGTAATLGATSCAGTALPTLERVRREGVVRVGISGERPFSFFTTTGRITGESPEVARAVLAGLGVSGLEAVQLPFGRLIPGLLDGLFDIVTAGMEITLDRCAEVAFSSPDFLAPTAFLVRDESMRELRGFGDVARAGIVIAVLDGSVEQQAARAAGVPDDRIETYDFQTDLVAAVASGEVAVGALTGISLRNALGGPPERGLTIIPGIVRRVDGEPVQPAAGFAFRPDDTALRDGFSAGLRALQASGRWLRITRPFGFTEENLPPRGLTTAELCSARR